MTDRITLIGYGITDKFNNHVGYTAHILDCETCHRLYF